MQGRRLLRLLLNTLIDRAVHPRAYRDPRLWALDTALHWLVERDLPPRIRLGKTLYYTGLRLLRGRGRQRWSGT